MKKKTLLLMVSCILATALTGCTKRPPKCSAPDTIEILSDLIIQEYVDLDRLLDDDDWMMIDSKKVSLKIGSDKLSRKEKLSLFSIGSIRKTGYDKELLLFSCEAELLYGKEREPFAYRTYLSDETGEHTVGIEFLSRYPSERVKSYFRKKIVEINENQKK